MTDAVKIALDQYFSGLVAEWERRFGTLPKTPLLDDVDPEFFVGDVDEQGWVGWRPIEQHPPCDLSGLDDQLGVQLHHSIRSYLSSYWFCFLGGKFFERRIQLTPVVPGTGYRGFLSEALGYRGAHGGILSCIPVGVETTGSLLVVVDNDSGVVELEDYEYQGFEELASSLDELILNLKI